MNDTLVEILKTPGRKLVVARNDIDLSTDNENLIFILNVKEERGAAGGRAAGAGSRRIDKIYAYRCKGYNCTEFFSAQDPQHIEAFDIPYSAVAMDIFLPDRKSIVVQGMIDKDLIASYMQTINNLNSG